MSIQQQAAPDYKQQYPTLHDAWRRFADYDCNAKQTQERFFRLRWSILIAGVLAVFFPLLQAAFGPDNLSDGLNRALRITIFVIPIVISILTLIAERFRPGERWVLLRHAAEELKKEIYTYRSHTGAYDETGEKPSREIQLADQMRHISERLKQTALDLSVIIPYDKPEFPPVGGKSSDDPGFDDLTPEQYIKWRLEDQRDWYRSRIRTHFLMRRRFSILIIALGGVSAFLAFMELELWVPLVTTLGVTFTSFLEFRGVDPTLTVYNIAARDLDNVLVWWHANPDGTFAELVAATEEIIANEHIGWTLKMEQTLQELFDDDQGTLADN